MIQSMYVRALSLWTLTTPNLPPWLSPYAHPAGTLPNAALLPVRTRGRASLLSRMFAEVIEHVSSETSLVSRSGLSVVFGSGNGELQTSAVLLQMMNDDDHALSPARFQASVHNTAAGLLSIALRARGFATCIAAGDATAAACFEEAASYLTVHGGEIVVALADESTPRFLADVAPCEPLAMAFRLSATPSSEDCDIRMRMHLTCDQAQAGETRAAILENPCANALPLCKALLERRSARLHLTAPWPCSVQVEPASEHETEGLPASLTRVLA